MSKKISTLELKKKITEAIKKDYGSVSSFITEDKVGKEIGKNLKVYLSPTGSVSYPVLKKLCTYLKIGSLDKKVEVIRKTTYSIQ